MSTSQTHFDEHAAVFVISVAAELAGMHPQTLRQYDRLGLVSPDRTAGRGRRYSARDIAQLREVQRLSQEEGVNLAGIKRILELENQVDALRARVTELQTESARQSDGRSRVRASNSAEPQSGSALTPSRRLFAAGAAGDIVSVPLGRRGFADPSSALVLWRQRP